MNNNMKTSPIWRCLEAYGVDRMLTPTDPVLRIGTAGITLTRFAQDTDGHTEVRDGDPVRYEHFYPHPEEAR